MLDVIIVGGGAAGLSAALTLGRARRQAVIINSGSPRNISATEVHGFLSRDGISPQELLQIGRQQLTPYDTVEYRHDIVVKVGGQDGAFEVVTQSGQVLTARKLLLATGLTDELPAKPGFQEYWGRGVYHCPFCHGWEIRDLPLAVCTNGEETLEIASLIRHWSRNLVLLSDGPLDLNETDKSKLKILGIAVKEEKIAQLEGSETSLERIVFEDGSSLARVALYIRPQQFQHSDLAVMLGCEIEQMGKFSVIKNDEKKQSTVPGVYIAGDAGTLFQQVLMAAVTGVAAAGFINRQLIDEEVAAELELK